MTTSPPPDPPARPAETLAPTSAPPTPAPPTTPAVLSPTAAPPPTIRQGTPAGRATDDHPTATRQDAPATHATGDHPTATPPPPTTRHGAPAAHAANTRPTTTPLPPAIPLPPAAARRNASARSSADFGGQASDLSDLDRLTTDSGGETSKIADRAAGDGKGMRGHHLKSHDLDRLTTRTGGVAPKISAAGNALATGNKPATGNTLATSETVAGGNTLATGNAASAGNTGRRAARGPLDPRLLRHAHASRGGIALLILIGFGQALATITVATALCVIVTATAAGTGVLSGTPAESLSALLPATIGGAITLLAAAFAARGTLTWAEQVVAQRSAARVTDELRQSLLDRVMRHGPAWVAAYGPGRLTTVLGTGLEALRPWFSGYLPALVLGILLPPLVVGTMAVVDPASAVVALLTIPLLPLLGALIGWATKARAEQRWAADSRLAGHFLDVVRGLPTLKMYGRANRQIHVISDLTDRHRAASMRVLRVAFLSSTALDLVGTLAVGMIAVQAGLRVAAGSMELGPALLVILLAPEAYRPLREMAARYHASTDAGAVIADVDEILSTPDPPSRATLTPATLTPPSSAYASAPSDRLTTPSPADPPLPDGGTPSTPAYGPPVTAGRSRDVTLLPPAFGHLTDPSGHLPPTTVAATTFDNVATGHLPPTTVAAPTFGRAATGHLPPTTTATPTFDHPATGHLPPTTTATPTFGRAASGRWGVRATGLRARYPGAFEDALHLPELAVRAGELVALRGLSGAGKTTALRVLAGLHPAEAGAIAVGSTFYLPQRPTLPHARTVAEAFPPDTTADDIRSALHVAGLIGEITGKTPLGEQVAGISAGQRQRLALAVLLHRATRSVATRHDRGTAPVVTLLLDEPTAHLDSTAERQVIDRLHEFAAQGCAVLVVAHRPALLAAADRIVDVHPPAGTALSRIAVTATFANPLELTSRAATPPESSPARRLSAPQIPADTQSSPNAPGTAPTTGQPGPASTQQAVDAQTTAATAGQPEPHTAQHCHQAAEPAPTAGRPQPASTQRGINTAEPAPGAGRPQPASTQRGINTAEPAPTAGRPQPASTRGGINTPGTTVGAGRPGPGGQRGVDVSGTADVAGRCVTRARSAGGEGGGSARDRDVAGRRWWGRVWVAAVLGAGSSVAGIVLTGAAAWLLVRASSLPPVLSLSAAVVLVRGSAVARPLLRYLERLVSHEVAFARLGSRRAAVYASLIPHVPGPRLHRRGDLLTRLVDDVDAGTDGLLRGRLPVIAAAITAGLGAAVVAGVTVEAAVPVALGLLVAGVLAPVISARQADRQELATGAARAALRDAVVETVDGIEELAGGGGRPDVPQERSRTLAGLEARAARGAGSAAAVAHVGWGAAVAGVAVVLARGGLTTEWSAVMLLGVVVLGEAVTSLPEAAIARRRAAGAERRVTALIENGPAAGAGVKDGAAEARDGAEGGAGEGATGDGHGADEAGDGDGAVRVAGLMAGWDPGRAPVLDGLGLELAAGSRTAIMGRSGCGKSTLAAVLAGLLPPRAGTVEVSGVAVLVGDETGHVFASTVRENLRLAAPAATDSQLAAVLVRVGLGWMDLDAWLGTGGGTISGGQRRRLATARALLADPALLILDEPTEGIDEDGARELMADLLGAASGRTVLVLAHRTDGLDLVDRLLVLESSGLKENPTA